MSNSNENDIKEKTLFENISDFGDFRNQFQQTIDFVVQDQSTNIDIDNFLKTLGSTFEDNGWQFKINNAQSAQSNTNTNDAQNLLSENRDNVNQNILNEITSGLDKQKQNKAACTKLFFDNLEAFELKIDSAEILWLLERLKSEKNRQEIGRYKNKLSEIFERYIKKLIHRSEILQLEEPEQKLLTDSLQALSSCIVRIIFKEDNRIKRSQMIIESFKPNFQRLEKAVTQRILSINSADRAKSKSEVVNDVFVILIDGIIALNRESDRSNLRKLLWNELFRYLMGSIKTNLKGLSLEIKLEIIKFLSRENSQGGNPKAKFDYLDYHSWDWETFTDLNSVFKLTIDKFDYNSLKMPDDLESARSLAFRQKYVPLRYIMSPFVCLSMREKKFGGGILHKLLQELKFPDYVNIIKNCHLSLIKFCFKCYNLENFDELLDDIKNVLRALLKHYKSNSKINSIIADLWEANFKAQINYLEKMCDFNKMRSRELKEGSDEKMAKKIEEIFDAVKKVFSSEVQPKTTFEAFWTLSKNHEDDKLKELIGDGNIFNLFLEYVEQNAKNDRSDEHTNKHIDKDLAQFNSLIAEIKNKNTSGKLSVDDKSSIVRFFVNKDFDYVNNLAQITNKLKKLTLKNDISDDNISSKENSAEKDVDSTKDDLKLNEQAKNESSNHLPNTKEEKEKAKAITQQNQEFKKENENEENYVEASKSSGSSINNENKKNNGVHQEDAVLLEEKERNEEKASDDAQNSLIINEQTKNELSNNLPDTKKEKEEAKATTQQNREFELEFTLSNNTFILSPSSCQIVITELRGCSDFCYQICLIKETLQQKEWSKLSGCWKQLWNELKWWERVKVTFYRWFVFWIAKLWHSSITIKIKSTMLTQQSSNFMVKSKSNDTEIRIPNSETENEFQKGNN